MRIFVRPDCLISPACIRLVALLAVIALPSQALADSVKVFTCKQNGQTIISDRPCAVDAKAETHDFVGASEEIQPPTSAARASRQSTPTAQKPPKKAVQESQSNTSKSSSSCEYDQQRIDSINAEMRRGYTSQQGEYLRSQLRMAQESYRKCKAQAE